MDVKKEIENYAAKDDKPILRWLLSQYHWESQWSFVTHCQWTRLTTTTQDLVSVRVWTPTAAGRALWDNKVKNEELPELVKKWRDAAKKLQAETKVKSQFSSEEDDDRLRDRAGEIEKCADELEQFLGAYSGLPTSKSALLLSVEERLKTWDGPK